MNIGIKCRNGPFVFLVCVGGMCTCMHFIIYFSNFSQSEYCIMSHQVNKSEVHSMYFRLIDLVGVWGGRNKNRSTAQVYSAIYY